MEVLNDGSLHLLRSNENARSDWLVSHIDRTAGLPNEPLAELLLEFPNFKISSGVCGLTRIRQSPSGGVKAQDGSTGSLLRLVQLYGLCVSPLVRLGLA